MSRHHHLGEGGLARAIDLAHEVEAALVLPRERTTTRRSLANDVSRACRGGDACREETSCLLRVRRGHYVLQMARIFSGIQPSGELHIGNYLGAVKNWVALQATAESFFCIVDYHAIIAAYDPADLRVRRRELAVGLLAAGLDPQVTTVFVQSDVPEHTELAWILNTVTPVGELERQTQFKDKSAK